MTLSDDETDRRAQLVATDYQGVLPMHVAFYAQSILFVASRAVHAFERFEAAAGRNLDAEAVSSLHEALGHAAAISRFFWPSGLGGRRSDAIRKLAVSRAARLRAMYAVDDRSPLKDRTLRDALEHFDERLDRYLLGLEAGYILPEPMLGPMDLGQDPVGHIFKLVDPLQEVFVLLGRRFSYRGVLPELRRIAARTEERAYG